MNGSGDSDVLVSEIYIAAPPERIFQALIDPAQVPQWWGQEGTYRCQRFASDLRPGGKWSNSGIGPDGLPFEISGEYLEIDPPRLLVQSWLATWTGDAETIVRWELTPRDEGTSVKIVHSGLSRHPRLAQSYRGWPRMLGWLQVFLERGETIDSRKAS